MNALTLVIVALCVFALGYRFYGLFIARRVLGLDPNRPTPAVVLEDGHDYHATNKYVIFGHHFAAIAAAGPLLGPVLAAQFGFLPGALWIIIGAVVAGAVHDMVILFASMRHEGKSISLIAEAEIGKSAGVVASFAVLFILILTLAGLSIAVVKAMNSSAWSAYTVMCTLPIALFMGIWMHIIRPGDVKGGSAIGVGLLALVIISGPYVAASPFFSSLFPLFRNNLQTIYSVLRFRCFGAPRVAPALPAGLSFHVPEAGHDRGACPGNFHRPPGSPDERVHQVRGWRRTHHQGHLVSISFHYHRLRRLVRFSRNHRDGNNSQDDRQREGHLVCGVRGDAGRGFRGDHGAYCGLCACPGGLFCDQCIQGSLCRAGTESGEPPGAFEGGLAKHWRGGPGEPSPWPLGWPIFSVRFRS